jgi:hypothetical protein
MEPVDEDTAMSTQKHYEDRFCATIERLTIAETSSANTLDIS